MLARPRNAPTALLRPLRRQPAVQARALAALASARGLDLLHAEHPAAEKLENTRLWTAGRKTKNLPDGDKHRVNIVSEGLCDDVLKYIGPSLERHRGCDLVDINPGVGVWSRKLHKVLQPRKHIMMEKDAEVYKPLLGDLIAKKNVEFVPKSGILWKDLYEILRTHLPNQVPQAEGATPQRNDSLLVSVNISMFPRRPFLSFECVSTMVLYQFMSSIKTASLFQQYGLVRMLIWVNDDEKRKLLPRTVVRRKRSAFEAELSCEWIREVAGKDAEGNRLELRDDWINTESAYGTVARMEEAGLKMPKNRQTKAYRDVMADKSLAGLQLAGLRQPVINRPFRQELEDAEAEFNKSDQSEVPTNLKRLRFREKYDNEDSSIHLELLKFRDAVSALAASKTKASATKMANIDRAYNERIDGLKKNPRNEYSVVRDNYHVFRQQPPAMFWDRRLYEPLDVAPTEFYPNAPCALLDLQPKSMHPLLRAHGPHSSRAADMSDVMLRHWFNHSLQPVSRAMDGLWPGFADLYADCSRMRDPATGGMPLSGHGELVARAVNEAQWTEMLERFIEWPFRPSYAQLVGRLVDFETDQDDDEVKSGALGFLSRVL